MDESRDGSYCLSWLSWDCKTVKIEISISGDSEEEWEASQSKRIRILEDDNPFAAFLLPFLCSSTHMKQSMDITMSVRFGFNLEFPGNDSKAALVVNHSWNLFLIENDDLILVKSKVFVTLEKVEGLSMRVFGCHYHQRNGLALAELSLESVNVFTIILEETLLSQQLFRNGDLDSLIAESLSQSSCNQNESCVFELLKSKPLKFLPSFEVIIGDGNAMRLANLIVRIGVDSKSGFLEQSNSIAEVSPQASGISSFYLENLLIERLLLLLGGLQVGISNMILLDFPQQLEIHQQYYYTKFVNLELKMGAACCRIFSKNQTGDPPPEQNHKTQLIGHGNSIRVEQHTKNDTQFTYFLGVFELRNCGLTLKSPEYSDEENPNFSYQKYNGIHKRYYSLVKELGLYIDNRSDANSSLHNQIAKDTKSLQEKRKQLGFGKSKLPGCVVKVQIQAVCATGADEIIILHHHSERWSGKFEQRIKIKRLQSGPSFFQFTVPEIFSSSIKIKSYPRQQELDINLNECFEDGKTTFCEVLKWKNGTHNEGVAARLQLFDGVSQPEKIKQMRDLYLVLMKQFQGDVLLDSRVETNQEIAERMSRHRSSLSHQYNLHNNSMF